MFAAASSLATTTTISSRGGYRGKEVVQKSRSSMRSTRRNDVNVVVRAEAQKTIDMNEVRFTKIDSFVFVALLRCCFLFSFGMEKGSIFLLLLLREIHLIVVGGEDERYRRQNRIKCRTIEIYFLCTHIMFC